LQRLLQRFLGAGDELYKLTVTLKALPKGDVASRADRIQCLQATRGASHARHVEMVQSAAIESFAGDPDAVELLRPFLAEKAELATPALRIIGERAEVRDLVRRQLRTGAHNARMAAVEILAKDEGERNHMTLYLVELARRPADRKRLWLEDEFVMSSLIGRLGGHLSTEYLREYLSDKSDAVREATVKVLLGRDDARELLIQRALVERAIRVQGLLWEKLCDEPRVRAHVGMCARRDQWALRASYFRLLSEDDARLDVAREYFRKLVREARWGEVAEMVGALARDGKLLPELRQLALAPQMLVIPTLFDALDTDDELRGIVRDHLVKPDWVRSYEWHSDTLSGYLADDDVAKTILTSALESGALESCRLVVLRVLRGYAGAVTVARKYVDDDDVNVSRAAVTVLAGEPAVQARLFQELHSEDGWVRRAAADALEDVPEAWEKLAGLREDPEKDIRMVAVQAADRLVLPSAVFTDALARERDHAVRRSIVGILGRRKDHAALVALRAQLASDWESSVRKEVVRQLNVRAPAKEGEGHSLRKSRVVSAALAAAATGGTALSEFLRSPRPVRRSQDPVLFGQLIGWLCAKLVATLPRDATMEMASVVVDDSKLLFGETYGDVLDGATELSNIGIRLSVDVSDLPRDRNIWPAANAILAWEVAQHLLTDRPCFIQLVCADVSFAHLSFPELGPGQVLLGPTLFGFRLAEESV
jgi:hypothetical protein